MTAYSGRNYTNYSEAVALTIETVSGQPLTETQKLAMSGSLALLLNKEFNDGRESIIADLNKLKNGASRG